MQKNACKLKKKHSPHLLRALVSLNGVELGAAPRKSASSDAAPMARENAEQSVSTVLASGSEKEKKVDSENTLLGSPL